MRRVAPAGARARSHIRGPRARCSRPSRTRWPYRSRARRASGPVRTTASFRNRRREIAQRVQAPSGVSTEDRSNLVLVGQAGHRPKAATTIRPHHRRRELMGGSTGRCECFTLRRVVPPTRRHAPCAPPPGCDRRSPHHRLRSRNAFLLRCRDRRDRAARVVSHGTLPGPPKLPATADEIAGLPPSVTVPRRAMGSLPGCCTSLALEWPRQPGVRTSASRCRAKALCAPLGNGCPPPGWLL